jgi:hypothetical protein
MTGRDLQYRRVHECNYPYAKARSNSIDRYTATYRCSGLVSLEAASPLAGMGGAGHVGHLPSLAVGMYGGARSKFGKKMEEFWALCRQFEAKTARVLRLARKQGAACRIRHILSCASCALSVQEDERYQSAPVRHVIICHVFENEKSNYPFPSKTFNTETLHTTHVRQTNRAEASNRPHLSTRAFVSLGSFYTIYNEVEACIIP